MFKNSPAFSGFSTNDIQKTKEFYQTTLGIEVSDDNGMVTLQFASGGKVLIYEKDDHKPATFTVLNFVVNNIEGAVEELTQKGIVFERYPGFNQNEKGISEGTPRIAWFKDPSDNILAVLEDTSVA